MSLRPRFEELDYRETPLGPLSLRRRREPLLGDRDVYEVKLGEAFLMSSLFHASETALAELALEVLGGQALDVVVGGLGLGYTAHAALRCPRVRSLLVVELFPAVIEWHRGGRVPLGEAIAGDPRCRIVEGDFFAMARAAALDPQAPGRRWDAILVDIDHSPRDLLDQRHAGFYTVEGLLGVRAALAHGGVLGLWSNDPPEEAFLARLRRLFEDVQARVVTFRNPYQDRDASSTVYLARAPGAAAR